MHSLKRRLAPLNEPPAPPLVNHGVQPPDIVQRRRPDRRLVAPLHLLDRQEEARVDDGEAQRPPAVRGAQGLGPRDVGRGGRRAVRVLERGGHERRQRAALREAHDAVDAAALADRLGDGRHARLEAAHGGLRRVAPEPGPRVQLVVVLLRVCCGGGDEAGDVGGGEADGGGGVDEGEGGCLWV